MIKAIDVEIAITSQPDNKGHTSTFKTEPSPYSSKLAIGPTSLVSMSFFMHLFHGGEKHRSRFADFSIHWIDVSLIHSFGLPE